MLLTIFLTWGESVSLESRKDDKNWDVYEESREKLRSCECGEGSVFRIEYVASHEKVPRVERYWEIEIICPNPKCPSK